MYLKVRQLADLVHAVEVGVHMLPDSLDTVLELTTHGAHQLAQTLDVLLPGACDLQAMWTITDSIKI